MRNNMQRAWVHLAREGANAFQGSVPQMQKAVHNVFSLKQPGFTTNISVQTSFACSCYEKKITLKGRDLRKENIVFLFISACLFPEFGTFSILSAV